MFIIKHPDLSYLDSLKFAGTSMNNSQKRTDSAFLESATNRVIFHTFDSIRWSKHCRKDPDFISAFLMTLFFDLGHGKKKCITLKTVQVKRFSLTTQKDVNSVVPRRTIKETLFLCVSEYERFELHITTAENDRKLDVLIP